MPKAGIRDSLILTRDSAGGYRLIDYFGVAETAMPIRHGRPLHNVQAELE